MFAQAVTRGKTVVFDRETYGCPGACAGLGFGTAYDKAMSGCEMFAAFFAKGLKDADDKEKYKAIAEKMNPHVASFISPQKYFTLFWEKFLLNRK
ncbi:MAG: DUF169 domain-containing protein [Thermodesulfobacteriota bacterium]|nr:DUF169 domain-containing protein [Thermodesulfobacteriota bacterium]